MTPRHRLVLLLILLAAACLWAGGELWRAALVPYKGFEGEEAIVEIPRGAGLAEIARVLHDAGVVRSEVSFRLLARIGGRAGRLQAGEYLFRGAATPGAVLDRIVAGDVLLHAVTLPEGITGREAIEKIQRAGLASVAALEEAFRDVSPIRALDPAARDLEGYLYPETYRFAKSTNAQAILGAMVARFREVFEGDLERRSRAAGLGVRQAVTLASLIEKETSVPAERPRISAVFHNRLRIGMPLQCDPTVIFALATDGRWRGALTRDDLYHASPYNTYVNRGLPPGPIASPGRAALEAAAAPAAVRDLYFVADGSGGHTFSISLEDHERAVARWRRIRRGGGA